MNSKKITIKLKALITILIIIFITEVIVMLALQYIQIESPIIENFLDSFSLSILSAPFIYYLLIDKILYKNSLLIDDLNKQKNSLDLAALVSETDQNGVITYANDKFCRVSGYSREELIGKNHNIVRSNKHSKEFWQECWKTISEGMTFTREVCNKAKDGSLYWVETTILPILSTDHIITGYSSVRIDITEKKKAQESERQLIKAKSEFLANMSHEIRTPMNGILGMVYLLSESKLTDDQEDMVSKISSSGNGLMTILNDILDLTKIESGKVELEIHPFLLTKCIQEVVDLLAAISVEKKIKIEVIIDESLPSKLIGDPTRIKQILINYLSNAIKFSEIGGRVILNVKQICTETKDIIEVIFSVKDFGPGISIVNQKKLFNAFVQADTSITRKFGGTGLGLAIISRLVKLMKGKVGLDSKEGEGSTFSVTLPLKEANHLEEIIQKKISKEELSSINHQILLVEDNSINQKIAMMMLKKLGYSCDVASNGLKALDKLTKKKYSLIFMDMQMPEMDGLVATEEIIKKYGDDRPPIIAMTANAFQEDKEKCFAAGMDHFISKPIKIDDLIQVLIEYRER